MKLEDLTPEQIAALKVELEAEEKQKKENIEKERKILKEVSAETVEVMFDVLTKASSNFSQVKGRVFDSFETLIKMKTELYSVKSDQRSHTFSSIDGKKRITLGYRILIRYDDTLDIGIAKIREYLESLTTNEDYAKLMSMVNSLLKKDSKGMLKPARILDLLSLADEIDSELFTDGVEIIKKSYKPEKSSFFIEAEFKDEKQKWQTVPLSVSSVDFPKKE
jgi:hypothetical protein